MTGPLDLPVPNIPLLRKAVEWAEAEAAKPADQRLWEQYDYVTEKECGTAYCVAGYVVAISPNVTIGGFYDWPLVDGEEKAWGEAGQQLLGLTDGEAAQLFYDRNDITAVRTAAEEIAARAGERL